MILNMQRLIITINSTQEIKNIKKEIFLEIKIPLSQDPIDINEFMDNFPKKYKQIDKQRKNEKNISKYNKNDDYI